MQKIGDSLSALGIMSMEALKAQLLLDEQASLHDLLNAALDDCGEAAARWLIELTAEEAASTALKEAIFIAIILRATSFDITMVDAFARLLADESLKVRELASNLMYALCCDAHVALLEATLSDLDQHPYVRARSAETLAGLVSYGSVAVVEAALHDTDNLVRFYALYALGTLGTTATLAALLRYQDPDPTARVDDFATMAQEVDFARGSLLKTCPSWNPGNHVSAAEVSALPSAASREAEIGLVGEDGGALPSLQVALFGPYEVADDAYYSVYTLDGPVTLACKVWHHRPNEVQTLCLQFVWNELAHLARSEDVSLVLSVEALSLLSALGQSALPFDRHDYLESSASR